MLALITKDVSKHGFMTEEQVIARAQYLDLVYTQWGTLYDNILNALRPSNIVPPPSGKESHANDGMIGSDSS